MPLEPPICNADGVNLQAVYWVETKGRTLEEIDAIFEGKKHSNVPDVAAVRAGTANVDVLAIEKELHEEKGLQVQLEARDIPPTYALKD